MDQIDDPIFPEAGHGNGTSVVGTTEAPGMTEADSPTTIGMPERAATAGLRPGFLAELAIAMRATAERERERIANLVTQDAAAHIERVRSRAAMESEELRRLAEDDVQRIEEWSATEMDRVRAEASRKTDDRRASLDDYLRQHDAIIETEIEGVDAALRDYGATLDQFFAELAQSSDPSDIVARAEALPAPPDLDQVRSRARSSAMALFAEPDVEDVPAVTSTIADEVAMDVGGATVDAVASSEWSVEPNADANAESSGEAETRGEADSPEVAAFALPTFEPDATNGSGEADAVAAEEPVATEEPITSTEPIVTEGDTEPPLTADPVPVMDPAATASPSWPAQEGASVEIAPTVDNTSAAVRLLRSVAPWTAPTHAGSENRSESE